MEILAAIGGGSFVLVSLIVGMRLLLLARKTRGLAELTMGASLFLLAGIGYPLMMLARFGTFMPTAGRVSLLVAYMLSQIVGIIAISTFNWRVFRPASSGALWAVILLPVGLTACLFAQLLGPGLEVFMLEQRGPWNFASPLFIVAMSWGGCESLRYHLMMRRRRALGLANTELTDRFGLWAVSILVASSMSAYAYVGVLLGVDVNATTTGPLVIGTLGLIAASCLWCAFIPPRWFTSWRSPQSTPTD